MIATAFRMMMLVGWVLLGTDTLLAQAPDQLCTELENVRPGEFLHSQTDIYLTTSTLRPVHEPMTIGRSLVKGAMAHRLANELGSVTLQWSGALLKGPVLCGIFNAYQVQVDPTSVRMSPN